MSAPAQRKAIEKFLAEKAGGTLLLSSRGLTFGGAGGSLAIILLIAQIGLSKTAVVWSLALSAIALPLWLALAFTYEIWLSLSLDVHDLYAVGWLHRVQAGFFYLSGALSIASIAFLVYALDSTIAWVFGAASLVGFIFVIAAFLTATYRVMTHMREQSGTDHE